jgi:PhnB protein
MKVKTAFMPELAISNGTTNVDFYKQAFNAEEFLRVNNDDGSIHVVVFKVDEAMFALHELTQWSRTILPDAEKGGTVTIGLMVDDVHAVVSRAVAAGAKLIEPVTDHEYGWRQGSILDPFGHRWQIQKIL